MNLINSTNTSPHSINASYGDVMSESTSTYYTNKSYLLDVIMKKLNISHCLYTVLGAVINF